MKIAVIVALTFTALVAETAPSAAEVEYPYCIINGGRSEGSWSCGYVSLAQCMQTQIGTDMCVINPRYQASPRERSRQRVPG